MILLILLLAFHVLPSHSFATDNETLSESFGIPKLEQEVPQTVKEIYHASSFADYSDLPSMLQKLRDSIAEQACGWLLSAVHGGAELLFIAVLTAVCSCFASSEALTMAGVISVSLVGMKGVSSCAEIGKAALKTIADFSHVLLPCLCTASAVSGSVTGASAKYAASVLFLDGVITMFERYAMPFLSGYAAVALTAQVTGNALLGSIGSLLKKGLKWMLVLLTAAFTIYLSVTGLMGDTADAVAAKTAKTAISGALPVVGGILADASAALLSGAQLLRNGIGVMGLFAVLAVCAAPYLQLGSHYLIYQVSSGAAVSLGNAKIGGTIKCLGDIYGFWMGMVGSAGVMLFVSIISLMKAVVT